MQEIWKDIKGYEGLYQVSNLGNIRSLPRYIDSNLKHQTKILRKGKILKQYKNHSGYPSILIKYNKINKHFRVHRLVAEAFIPNPNNYPQVNHIDENKNNNCITNLEWCTQEHNIKEAFKLGLYKTPVHCYKKGDNGKPINQYDLQGNFIKTWNSITEAGEQFKNRANNPNATISLAIRKSKNKVAFDYIWKYAN